MSPVADCDCSSALFLCPISTATILSATTPPPLSFSASEGEIIVVVVVNAKMAARDLELDFILVITYIVYDCFRSASSVLVVGLLYAMYVLLTTLNCFILHSVRHVIMDCSSWSM